MVSILFLLAATQGGFAADPSLLRRGVTAARYTKPRLAVAEPPTTDLAAAEPPRPIKAFPCGDDLDKRITTLAVPALLNFLILPITGAVDLLFIGQLGEALATAGQAAANQVYSTAALLSNVIPVVTVPLVAKAYAAGDEEEVQRQVGGAIFLSITLGALVSLIVGLGAKKWLLTIGTAAALPFSLPYLIYRLPGVIPDTLSTVGFSSLRGVMDTVTPLKVAIIACVTNALFNYILMFKPLSMGIAGAALATAISQIVAGSTYMAILLRRKLVKLSTALRPPSKEILSKIVASGGAVQVRNIALNVAFIAITKTTQGLDTTGVAAAAHAVTIALWQLGGVVLFAMGSVATILTSAELGKKGNAPGGLEERRKACACMGRFDGWPPRSAAALRLAATLALHAAARGTTSGAHTVHHWSRIAMYQWRRLCGRGRDGRLRRLRTLSGWSGCRDGPLPPLAQTRARDAGRRLVVIWVFNSVRLFNFINFFWFAKSPLMPGGRPLPWEGAGKAD